MSGRTEVEPTADEVRTKRGAELLRIAAATTDYHLQMVLNSVTDVQNVEFLRAPLRDALEALRGARRHA